MQDILNGCLVLSSPPLRFEAEHSWPIWWLLRQRQRAAGSQCRAPSRTLAPASQRRPRKFMRGIYLPQLLALMVRCSHPSEMLFATKLPIKCDLNNKEMLSHTTRTSEVDRSEVGVISVAQKCQNSELTSLYFLVLSLTASIAISSITSHGHHPKEVRAFPLDRKLHPVSMPKLVTIERDWLTMANLD